jgi:hypothetical protein
MGWIEDISGYLSRLTDDQIDAAVALVVARQFNKERQPLDFDTAIERLRWCRDVVQAALDNGLLPTLPMGIQKEIRDALSNTVAPVGNIVAGNDHLSPLATSVDALHLAIWRSRIAEQGEQVVNFATKIEQLTRLSGEAQRLRAEFQTALKQAAGIQALLQQARDATSAATQARSDAQNAQQQTSQVSQQAQTALTQATERNTQINTLLGQAQSSRQQIAAFEADLKALHTSGQQFRKTVAETEVKAQEAAAEVERVAQETVAENTKRTTDLIQHLESLEERTKDALQKATGVSLFSSFNTRKDQISKGKWPWAVAAGLLGAVTITLVALLAFTCTGITPAFYFKLGVALPIGGLIWFCVSQYNHERRLEEEYAFKSNISLSLVPYEELVEKSVRPDDASARSRYCEFLISSVDKVFTPPADNHRAQVDVSVLKSLGTEQLKQLTDLVTSLQRLVRG